MAASTKADTAESTPDKKKAEKLQGKDGVYWIVNPAGAVHNVSKQHGVDRMMTSLGYRWATEAEITKCINREVQRFDDPICEAWSPEPPEPIETP